MDPQKSGSEELFENEVKNSDGNEGSKDEKPETNASRHQYSKVTIPSIKPLIRL